MTNHKAVTKTPRPLRNFQIYKGDERNPKSMVPFCNPCMNANEASVTIREDQTTLATGVTPLYAIHCISENRIIKIVYTRPALEKVAA